MSGKDLRWFARLPCSERHGRGDCMAGKLAPAVLGMHGAAQHSRGSCKAQHESQQAQQAQHCQLQRTCTKYCMLGAALPRAKPPRSAENSTWTTSPPAGVRQGDGKRHGRALHGDEMQGRSIHRHRTACMLKDSRTRPHAESCVCTCSPMQSRHSGARCPPVHLPPAHTRPT